MHVFHSLLNNPKNPQKTRNNSNNEKDKKAEVELTLCKMMEWRLETENK